MYCRSLNAHLPRDHASSVSGITPICELASALINSENYTQGLAALDRIKALGKETAGDLFFRAITLDKLHQLKPALAAYEEFLAADNGAHPDQEFQARQRARIIKVELTKR